LPICQNQIQELFKDHTCGSAVSSPSGVWGRAPAANAFLWHYSPGNASGDSNHLFGYSVYENIIQGLSRTMSVFKDSPGLENLEKNSRTFKDLQELCILLYTGMALHGIFYHRVAQA